MASKLKHSASKLNDTARQKMIKRLFAWVTVARPVDDDVNLACPGLHRQPDLFQPGLEGELAAGESCGHRRYRDPVTKPVLFEGGDSVRNSGGVDADRPHRQVGLLHPHGLDDVQVWSLTQFYSVDFSKSRIELKKCVFNKRTIKVCVSCC